MAGKTTKGDTIVAKKIDKTLNEKVIAEFIVYLYEGFQKFGKDIYADHAFYVAVRYITDVIGKMCLASPNSPVIPHIIVTNSVTVTTS
ncbi:hypothetical protein [Treponema primitia]|uniref:hypothetical protein n=1 Tax=Treponema primitia TaxID=88058 RepID=UPI0002555089|nr:hypothetical protein [Treponema primitia]